MNVIIVIEEGIIQRVITCKCTTQAGAIYLAKAREMGVEIESWEENKALTCDMYFGNLVNRIDEELFHEGKELKWIESQHFKKIQ